MEEMTNCRCCFDIIRNTAFAVAFAGNICLKVSDLAKVKFDDFGFICENCERILNEIDNFTYKVLETQHKFNAVFEIGPPENIPIKSEIDFEPVSVVFQENYAGVKEEDEKAVFYEHLTPTVKLETIEKKKKTKTKVNKKKVKEVPNPKSSGPVKKKRGPPLKYLNHFCPICNKYFVEARKIQLHIDRIHNAQRNFSCDLCSYTAFKKNEIMYHFFNMHMPKEHLVKKLICSICGEGFPTTSLHTKHMKRKHLKIRKRECDVCGMRYEAMNEIRRHMRTHLPDELKDYYDCEFCPKRFNSKGALKTHVDSKHLNLNPFVCNICGKTFQLRCTFMNHQKVHSDIRPFKCELCKKEFRTRNNLKVHVKAFHIPVVYIPCQICGQKYKSEEGLKRHMAYHSEPRFSCTVCDKKFHENKNLMNHMGVHQKLPFQCPSCPRTFRTEGQLRCHGKKCHNTEKLTFRCELCSTTLTRKSTYKDHAVRQHKELNEEELAAFLERIKASVPEEHKYVARE